MNLYDANYQWQNRPDDERFETPQQMRDACKAYADSSRTTTLDVTDLRIEADSGDLRLLDKTDVPAKLTHYAFGQLSRMVGAPADYLRRLPAGLVAQNVNHGLKLIGTADPEKKASLLFHQNGSLVTRAINSDSYDRVWNWELVDTIINRLLPEGWRTPPARPSHSNQKGTRLATAEDILPNQGDFGLSVKVGDEIAPAGLYASDHDMFAFLVDPSRSVDDGQKLLNRGVFIQNSEVGDCALKFKLFTYDNVCGNLIVWGVGKVTEVSVRHIKGAEIKRGDTLRKGLTKWTLAQNDMPAAGELEANIKAAKSKVIAVTKEEVLDAVLAFAKVRGLNRLGKKVLEGAYETATQTPRYGNPNTVWAMVNGLTENSQVSHTDNRIEMDTQAGRVFEMAF